MDQQFHTECLQKLCRVCGSYLQHSRAVYRCEDHQHCLLEVFRIDLAQDLEHIHPPHLCEHCQAVMSKAVAAGKDVTIYLHFVKAFEWSEHAEVEYHVCNHVAKSKKGGRPKKARKNRGRPIANSAHTRLDQLQSFCTQEYLPEQMERGTLTYYIPSSLGVKQSDLECPLCMILLDRPVLLACGTVLCTECVYR